MLRREADTMTTRQHDDVEGAPVLELHGAEFQGDPNGTLRACRARGWYATTAMGPALLSYDEVQSVMFSRQFRTLGVDLLTLQGITEGPLVGLMQGLLLATDGAVHERMRRLVVKAFSGARVERFRPRLRELAEPLARRLGDGEHDFITDFAGPFGLAALGDFVGIPRTTLEQVARWTADIALVFGMSVPENASRIEAALAALHPYIDELLAIRRATPEDDLLSALIAAEETGDLLSDTELRLMIVTLMSAGHHTMVNQLGHALVAFMAEPEQWQILRADPSLAQQAAEEVVRLSPAALLGVPRVARTEVVVRDLTIAAGTCVLPLIGAANRDPAVFTAPDRLDITSKRRPHLTYGGGVHHCLGFALARGGLQEALTALAAHIRAPQPTGPATWLPPTEAVYGPTSLPMHDAGA